MINPNPSPLASKNHSQGKVMATFESVQTGNIHIDQGDRTVKNLSPLALDRVQYKPRYPDCLENPEKICVHPYSGLITI